MPTRLFLLLLKTNRATLLFKSPRDDLQRKIRGEILFFFFFSFFKQAAQRVPFRVIPSRAQAWWVVLDEKFWTTNSRGNSSEIIQVDKRRVVVPRPWFNNLFAVYPLFFLSRLALVGMGDSRQNAEIHIRGEFGKYVWSSASRVKGRIVFACSPYKILRHVSPSTTESSANVTCPLPAASVWLRLWPFCTVNLKFQGRFEQVLFLSRAWKLFAKFPPSLVAPRIPARPFHFDPSNSIAFSCDNARRKLSRIFENLSTIYEFYSRTKR